MAEKEFKRLYASMDPATKGRYAAKYEAGLWRRLNEGEITREEADIALNSFIRAISGFISQDEYITFLLHREHEKEKYYVKELLKLRLDLLYLAVIYLDMVDPLKETIHQSMEQFKEIQELLIEYGEEPHEYYETVKIWDTIRQRGDSVSEPVPAGGHEEPKNTYIYIDR